MANENENLEVKEQDLDLDLDLDSVDLDSLDDEDIDNLDLNDFGVIDDSIEYPHIKMSTKAFKEVLKVARQVGSTSGRDVISKSICLIPEGDKVICCATDFDVYLESKVDLLNTENLLNEPVVIPIDILMKLSKAVPNSIIIFRDDENVKMRLVGGDIPLETHNVDISKFRFTEELTRESVIASKDLYGVMKDFGGIVTSAVSPTERRIICEADKAIASYMWAIISAPKPFANMDLKTKDINVLKVLTVGSDEDLEVFTTTNAKITRKVVKGQNFMYAFLISDLKVSETLKDNMSKVAIDDGVFVDFLQLYKMIELASELPYSIGKVGVNYTEEGDVQIAIKTKKGKDSLFRLSGSAEGTLAPLKEELVLQAKLLKILLRSFAGQSSVKLSVTSDGLGVACVDYIAAVYNESTN